MIRSRILIMGPDGASSSGTELDSHVGGTYRGSRKQQRDEKREAPVHQLRFTLGSLSDTPRPAVAHTALPGRGRFGSRGHAAGSLPVRVPTRLQARDSRKKWL